MRSASAKPRVMTSAVRSPLRSSSALVATVVPIFTASMRSAGNRRVGANPKQLANPLNCSVAIALRILRKQLERDDSRRPAGDR